jgi:hypothetical protein
MPLLTIVTSKPVERSAAEALLVELSRQVAELLAKPERYVATAFFGDAPMTFGGSPAPSCLIEVANVGELAPQLTAQMSRALCAVVGERLSVATDRIYVRFQTFEGHYWGHRSGTFG